MRRDGSIGNVSRTQCRNGIQYSSSKPTSPVHGPTIDRQAAARDPRHARGHAVLGLGAALIDAAAAQQAVDEVALPSGALPRALERAAVGGSVLAQRVGRVFDGVEPRRQRIGAPAVVDAQVLQVLEHGAQLLAILLPSGIERPAQPCQDPPQSRHDATSRVSAGDGTSGRSITTFSSGTPDWRSSLAVPAGRSSTATMSTSYGHFGVARTAPEPGGRETVRPAPGRTPR